VRNLNTYGCMCACVCARGQTKGGLSGARRACVPPPAFVRFGRGAYVCAHSNETHSIALLASRCALTSANWTPLPSGAADSSHLCARAWESMVQLGLGRREEEETDDADVPADAYR
jgi:hypothetical protein